VTRLRELPGTSVASVLDCGVEDYVVFQYSVQMHQDGSSWEF
jgi:hypothetical protein